MQSLFFWKSWPQSYRGLWYFLSLLFIISVVMLWVYHFMGPSTVIDWQRMQEQKIVETTVHTFRLGQFQLSVPAESYVILEYLGGSGIVHNLAATYLFLFILFFSTTVLLSVITTLEKFWFFAGMGIFILFMVILRLDVLELFGMSNQIPAIAILSVYLGAAFYFKYVRTYTTFISRFLTFLAITIITGVIVAVFAEVPNPALHLLVTAYTPALIFTVLFIIMVAHEIVVGFVYITNQSKEGSSTKHFSIISGIYLTYLIITCLHELDVINWDFIYINLYLLLTISAVLGIWGFRLREPLYENIFSFSPFGALFVLALGAIGFATISQLLGNSNDAGLEVVRDTIVYAHTGFGIIFMMYFFSNFMEMMEKNLPVYNILYKPNRMPYFTFRFAGLIASLAFLFYGSWRDYVSNGVGGFYNYVGDMHLNQGNDAYAITFYNQAKRSAFQDHRANYMLATLNASRLNIEGSEENYDQINRKNPSDFSLVNEGNLNFWEARYFDAIKDFKRADEIHPNVPAIQNNLGYSYTKVHALDSASFYLNKARESDETKNSAETNFFAMTALELIPIDADSTLKYFDTQSPSVTANAIAVATLFDQEIKTSIDPLAEKELDLYTATLLNNYINHFTQELDSAFIERANQIASDSINFSYTEALKASLAHSFYHQGKVYTALDIMNELAYRTQNYQGKFNYIMGLWALEQGSPEDAIRYFTLAETADYKDSRFYNAIARTEAKRINEAIVSWDSLMQREEPSVRKVAEQIRTVLRMNAADAMTLPDPLKYQFCRYKVPLLDTMTYNRIAASLESDNYKAQAYLDRATQLYKADKTLPAIQYLNKVTGMKISDKQLYDDIRHLELLLLASRREMQALANQINNNISFEKKHALHKRLYTALLHEVSGDTTAARKQYDFIATANPFFEEGILAAVAFFRNQDSTSLKPYNILVDAIYINTRSPKLLKAYAAEAARQGFDDYAASAVQTLNEIEERFR